MLPLRLPSTPQARAPAIAAALSAIKRQDPAFDVDSLMRRLPTRFLELRGALNRDDLTQLREYTSEALFQRWQRDPDDRRSVLEGPPDLGVQEVRLVWAENHAGEDRVTLGIDCLATSDDHESLQTLTQYWSLVRDHRARSPQLTGPDQCPHCGAPADRGLDHCRYCDLPLPGPLQGWRLDRVYREVDWYEGPPGSTV
jgi:predicted lipid-binding transport protein (Tim44 family)